MLAPDGKRGILCIILEAVALERIKVTQPLQVEYSYKRDYCARVCSEDDPTFLGYAFHNAEEGEKIPVARYLPRVDDFPADTDA